MKSPELRRVEKVSDLESPRKGPIMACVGSVDDFESEDKLNLVKLRSQQVDYEDMLEGKIVDGHLGQSAVIDAVEDMKPQAFHVGYVMSNPNVRNKASRGYGDCVGFVLVGIDKKEQTKNVSILMHLDPKYILSKDRAHNSPNSLRDEFELDLKKNLHDFADKVQESTVDVVFFGGSLDMERSFINDHADSTRIDDYGELVTLVSQHVRDTLHKEPHALVGPNEEFTTDPIDVILDTHARRLFILQEKNKKTYSYIDGFDARDVKDRIEQWKKEVK